MKVKRYKHARKYLGFYRNNFNFREPHQVLVDGTFSQMALKNKINIKEQLPKYLGGEVQLFTTSCILAEAQLLGNAAYGAYVILKRYQVRRCGHRDEPASASDCVMSMIGEANKNHYYVATQDPDLSRAVNNTPGTPLLYVHSNAIVLEKPSQVSLSAASSLITSKINPSDFEKSALSRLKGEDGAEDESKKKRKRKGPKGPNPLSVKKKKKVRTGGATSGGGASGEGAGKKRKRRKRVKVASHVKEQMSRSDGS